MKQILRATALGLLASASLTWAAAPPASLTMIPPLINYQGRLVTPVNAPYSDATHTIDLSLYFTPSGGGKVWSERYAVQTRDGYFSVNLGTGGTGLLASNAPIWQVLWNRNTGGLETNDFFMALTVRTDSTGAPLATPVESTPRQQFLTAPFAYRAHQSVYASKADGLFSAPSGVQTPTLSSTTNEVRITSNVRMEGTTYGNSLYAHGSSPTLKLLSSGGPLYLGVSYYLPPFYGVGDYASSINIGAQPSAVLGVAGTDIQLDGRAIDLGTTNLTVNNKPMFVRKAVQVSVATTTYYTSVSHTINTADYDVVVVGFYASFTSPGFRAIFVNPGSSSAIIYFNGTPSGGTATLHFLGIRKGLTDNQ